MNPNKCTLLISCPDQKGLVAKITHFFYQQGFNILSCQQYVNSWEQRYFMRICLDAGEEALHRADFEEMFSAIAKPLQLSWSVHYHQDKARVAIMVSHESHCLYDLLERHREGLLNCDIPVVVSNHDKLRPIANLFNIPFHHLPIASGAKKLQEQRAIDLLKEHRINLVVMARYMQILSADFIDQFPSKIINIHHSFLPAFQGANPYKRAYKKGVKLIGATAHYATKDLDEGAIIEQGVARVSHDSNPQRLKEIGAETERSVLGKAVNFHLNHQIIVDGNKTIIFPETET